MTAAALVNELVEAKQNNQVRRLMARWQKYELIALDEVGYVPLADIGGVSVPGHFGAGRESGHHCDHEFAVLGMDHGVSESTLVQSPAGPSDRPGSYRRDRNRIVPLPPDDGKEEEKTVSRRLRLGVCRGKRAGLSFLRHGQIYQSDVVLKNRDEAGYRYAPGLIVFDEFANGYSLAGCTPAEPASASPIVSIFEPGLLSVNRGQERFAGLQGHAKAKYQHQVGPIYVSEVGPRRMSELKRIFRAKPCCGLRVNQRHSEGRTSSAPAQTAVISEPKFTPDKAG
jgi:hypothetical protein